MEIKNQRILILAPHTDDAEFGMGGSIAKFIEQGNEVFCAAFSACRNSVREGFHEDILIAEVKEASAELGIAPDHLLLFEYEVRTFNFRRQEILDDLIKLRETIKPNIIFIPSLNDIHQDHFTISQEAVRAFKFSGILCYELPWNNFNFNTACFVILNEGHVAKKAKAVSMYKSQAHRNYASDEFIRSLARTRGVQVGAQYAESFEITRWVL